MRFIFSQQLSCKRGDRDIWACRQPSKRVTLPCGPIVAVERWLGMRVPLVLISAARELGTAEDATGQLKSTSRTHVFPDFSRLTLVIDQLVFSSRLIQASTLGDHGSLMKIKY